MQKRNFFSSDTAIMNQPLSHNSLAEIISESKLSGDRALAIIDSALDHVELLIAGVKAGTEVVVLHPHEDGVKQITAALRQNNQFSSVHLIAHSSSGSLQLGSTKLSLENVDSYASELQVWSKFLAETPLLIYGCELAQGRKGQNFIDRLQELTKTDIAASTTKIGSSQQGGNWQLDYQLGKVAPELVLTEEIQSTYSGVFVQVGLSVTTDYGPDNSVLVEDQNNNITFRFDLDEAAPAGGLTVYVRGDLFNSLSNYQLSQVFNAANSENIELGGGDPAFPDDEFPQGDFEFNGIAVTIREGATFGTVTLPVFDGAEPDPTGPAETFDGLRTVTYSLLTRDQIPEQDLGSVEDGNGDGVDDYTIDPNAATAGPITLVDTESQLPVSGPITVGISIDNDIFIEDEGTINTITFTLSDPAPAEGLVISFATPKPFALGDFSFIPPPFPVAVFTGATLIQGFADNDGGTIRIEPGVTTATIDLPVFDDPDRPNPNPPDDPRTDPLRNDDIGVEQLTFTVDPQFALDQGLTVGDYVVDPAASEIVVTLADTASQLNNSPPVATDDEVTTVQDNPLNIDVLGNDTDPDPDNTLAVESVTQGANGTVTINDDGTVNYAPNAGFSGEDTFTYTVSDGNGGTDDGSVTVTVDEVIVNSDPVATNDTATAQQDGTVDINVLGNDTDPDTADVLSVESVGTAGNGTVTINDDGTVNYTPDAGFFGTDTFDYTVSDGNGGTDTGSVTVTVDEVIVIPDNIPPTATDDTATAQQDGTVDIDVLGNDTDPDTADVLSVDSVGTASNGTVTINDDGIVNYTPDAGFFGEDSFTYTVSDGNGGTDEGSVTVTVNEIVVENTPPIATDDTGVTLQDSPVDIDVLGNDTDDNGDVLSVDSVGAASNGTVTINDDGTVNYTPDAGFFGEDSFTYTVSDGNGGTDEGAVTVTVNEIVVENTPPIATDDTGVTLQDSPVDIAVLANDSDPNEGDVLAVDSVGTASNGTVTINDDGTVNYTPDAGFFGEDSFTYTVSDGNGGTDEGAVTVTVNEIVGENIAPVAIDDIATTQQDGIVGVDIDVLANDTDENTEDVLSVSSVTEATNGTVTINDDGTVNYTPDAGFFGEDIFTYTVSDGNGGTDVGDVTVTVDEIVVVPPIITGTSGRDALTGDDEDNQLIGLQGRDILTGGGGSDEFVYTSIVDAGDTITDFEVGTDTIVLTDVLDSLGYDGTDAIADGYIDFGSRGASDTFVQIDPDGSGGPGSSRIFILVEGVTPDELNNPANFDF